MAVLGIRQIRSGASAGDGEGGTVRTYVYLVECDDLTDTPDTALSAVGLPGKGTNVIIPGGTVLTVKSRHADHLEETPLWFRVTVEIGPREGSDAEIPEEQVWDVEVTIDGVPFEESVNEDVEHTVLVNSAEDLYDLEILRTYYDEEISLSFKTKAVNQAAVADTRGKINSGAVTMNVHGYVRTFAEETLCLTKARQRTVVGTADDPYWAMDYVLLYKKDGWRRKIVNRGFHFIEALHDKKIKFTDDNGEPVSVPGYLTATGRFLPPGDPVTFKTYLLNELADFGPLFTGL